MPGVIENDFRKKRNILKLVSICWWFGLLEVKKTEGLNFITKTIKLTLFDTENSFFFKDFTQVRGYVSEK